jgi:uncharacterized protein (TIGR02300 family)
MDLSPGTDVRPVSPPPRRAISGFDAMNRSIKVVLSAFLVRAHFGFDRDGGSWQLPPSKTARDRLEHPVAKSEWGTKRICQNCGTKFYDLQREHIVCPKCQTEYDPEAFLKTRRSRPAAVADKEVAPAIVADAGAEVEDEVLEDEEEAAVAGVAGEEEDEDLIEDASELGEDEDDMAEVIENVDEEEER